MTARTGSRRQKWIRINNNDFFRLILTHIVTQAKQVYVPAGVTAASAGPGSASVTKWVKIQRKKSLLLILIHFWRREPVHAVMFHILISFFTHILLPSPSWV